MPPFQRRWYYNYKRRQPWRRRFRNRRFRRPLRRYRRRFGVRKRKFYRKKLRKLKYIKLNQWQPQKIKKCKILGTLQLFGCTWGTVSNNFVLTKESYIPDHWPGGGGWGMQQLTLSSLYDQNVYCMNYWTKSNKGFNLCRYMGMNVYLYRQENVDWIFTYNLEEPLTIGKYTYASYHPFKLMQYTKRIILPSYKTAPLKRKRIYKKFIKPPKKLTNQWYFQNHFRGVPLLTFFATACDLSHIYLPKHSKNSNITLWCLNTKLFEHPRFQDQLFSTTGFNPDIAAKKTLWGLPNADTTDPATNNKGKDLVYLGNSMYLQTGITVAQQTNKQQYTRRDWGNPFHPYYNTNDEPTYLLIKQDDKQPIDYIYEKKDSALKDITGLARRFEDILVPVRYNPNKDKGLGNVAYFLRTDKNSQKGWEPPDDQDIIISNFPLWLMLWGFEDYMRKLNKINNLDTNGILVIHSDYFNEKYPAYILLSDNFKNGLGPYETGEEEITVFDRGHWYPCWYHQKQAINNLLSTGPGVCRPNENESIESFLKYKFFFKWGGNPSTMETVYDPSIQPVGPDPNNQLQTHEIISPEETIENYIYNWDTRRDMLTQAASTRIEQIQINEQSLFTDGIQTSTDIPTTSQKAQKKKTQEETQEELLQQLNIIQQHNKHLLQRFRKLKTLTQNM
nr:MAG: ORF1 [TTV-like mini virus]